MQSVFDGAAVGDSKGARIGPGIEKVHQLLASSDEAVSVDDVRGVYEEQQWDENALLDLQQFTTLWAATVGDKDVVPVKVPEVSAAGEKINESFEKGIMSKAEAVFCGATVGDAKGWLPSPGVEGVHILMVGADESVSVEAIRKVYKDQKWDEKASLDLKQFTTL